MEMMKVFERFMENRKADRISYITISFDNGDRTELYVGYISDMEEISGTIMKFFYDDTEKEGKEVVINFAKVSYIVAA